MKQDAHKEKLVHQHATLLWTAPSPSPLVESVLVSPLIATLFGNLFRTHTNQYMARRGFIVNLPGVPLRLLRGSHLSKSLVAPLSTLLFISTPLYWSMPHDRSVRYYRSAALFTLSLCPSAANPYMISARSILVSTVSI